MTPTSPQQLASHVRGLEYDAPREYGHTRAQTWILEQDRSPCVRDEAWDEVAEPKLNYEGIVGDENEHVQRDIEKGTSRKLLVANQ